MKLHGRLTINKKTYETGDDLPWYNVYPFFLIHMLAFGGTGFLMAYGKNGPPLFCLFLSGGFAIAVYTVFYLAIFGRDEIKWMFINAGIGLLGIYSQIGWLLSLFGRKIGDYPVYLHVIPFLYFVLYTFLIRHALLDIFKAREDDKRKKFVENAYIAVSIGIYVVSYFLERR
jgi:hypothetical protein